MAGLIIQGTTLMQSRIKSLLILSLILALGQSMAPTLAETVLITGSNQGIGLEFAKQYAARGWTVIATHRRPETPDTLVALQQKYPDLVQPERMDVTKKDEIVALAEKMKGE